MAKQDSLLGPFRNLRRGSRASRGRTGLVVNEYDNYRSESYLDSRHQTSRGDEFAAVPLRNSAPEVEADANLLIRGNQAQSVRSLSTFFSHSRHKSSEDNNRMSGSSSLEGSTSEEMLSQTEAGFGMGPRLHPFDGGRHAWLYLIGASMIEGLMWGFPITWGVFQTYYETHVPFEGQDHLAMVGTLTTGISYLGTILITPLTIKYPKYQRTMIVCGWMICIISLIGSSFSTKLWHLMVSQGVGYGFGFLIVYYPLLSMLNEWFVERRGFAYGVLFGSAGIFGLGLPFLAQVLLEKFGYAMTLRIYAIGIFILVGPFLTLLKPRIPPKTMDAKSCKFDFSVLKKVNFSSASVSNIFQGLVFFLPGIYLPSYASSLKLSSTQGSLVLSLLNLAQVIGQIVIGLIADSNNVHIPMFLSTSLSVLSVLLLWGFSTNLGYLFAFALFYGFVAGGYSVLYCRFVTALSDERGTGLWLYAIFEFQRGAGNILGGYVSGLLLNEEVDMKSYGIGKFGGVVVFVGMSMAVASLGGLGWVFEKRKSIWREGKGSWKRISQGRSMEFFGGHQNERLFGPKIPVPEPVVESR